METEIKHGHRPSQTPENLALTAIDSSPKPTDAQVFEKWCQLKALSELRQRYSNLPPEDRYLPLTEPQEARKIDDIDPEKYLADESRIRTIFNRRLCISGQDQNVIRNYDPVLAVAMAEQMQTPEQREVFVKHETTQVITALSERFNVVESIASYAIDGSKKLRSSAFPTESFEVVIGRGIKHRKKMGSPDVEREEAELSGFIKIQETMTNPATPKGYKKVVISGPSFLKGTTFTHNFVDIYELKEDFETKQRFVEMTRFASNATYEEYKNRITKINPAYFNEAKGSLDAYLLENPIGIDPRVDKCSTQEIFKQLSGTMEKTISNEDFQKITEDGKPRIAYYLEAVCSSIFDPEEIALRFNAILKGAELAWKKIQGFKEKLVGKITNFVEKIPVFKNIADEVSWLGRQIIEKVMAGCGLSGGISLDGAISSVGNLISSAINSIGGISGFSKDKDYCIRCGACGEEIKCVVRKGGNCPKCRAVRQC